ncbi:hypothetical protein [uncultured Paracoccus sp.]|uniref:hypothetical protein n=1 Tax=uncultured Paracoccus sp. TaxID=189685 RepID=UPI0025D77444|nr:hypothetical protein [uncultured Paracoccus sp.]
MRAAKPGSGYPPAAGLPGYSNRAAILPDEITLERLGRDKVYQCCALYRGSLSASGQDQAVASALAAADSSAIRALGICWPAQNRPSAVTDPVQRGFSILGRRRKLAVESGKLADMRLRQGQQTGI